MSDNRQDRAAEVRWALATENTELRKRNEDLKEKLTAAAKIIQEREDMCDGANEAIAMYKKRIAELEIAIETLNTRREITKDIVIRQRERIAELEAENTVLRGHVVMLGGSDEPEEEAEAEPTPGFFNAENMHYLHKMAHNHERRISALERAQRESKGEF